MKHLNTIKLISILVASATLVACNQGQNTEPAAELNLEDPATARSYALGVSSGINLAQNLANFEGSDIAIDSDVLSQGFIDGMKDTSKMEDEAIGAAVEEFRQQAQVVMQAKQIEQQAEAAKEAEANLAKGAEFLAANKEKEGVIVTDSGLQYKVLTAGEGNQPGDTDSVSVHYSGTLIDGTQFDSSYDRGEPATFPVTGVIKGWVEALQLMKEGAKWQLTIPAELAYGAQGRPSIPGNSVLIFDVELLAITSQDGR